MEKRVEKRTLVEEVGDETDYDKVRVYDQVCGDGSVGQL